MQKKNSPIHICEKCEVSSKEEMFWLADFHQLDNVEVPKKM